MITPTDPLSDLLRTVRLDGAYFLGVEARNPWRVLSPEIGTFAPRILPTAGHVMSFHLVTGGTCHARLVGEEAVELVAGDVIVFPHGGRHELSSDATFSARNAMTAGIPARFPHTVVVGDDGPVGASFVCGYLGCDRLPVNPFLAALPRQIHVRAMSTEWLATFIEQLTEESSHGRAGADTVLTRLAELMLVDVLRRYLDEIPAAGPGSLAGLGDDVVSRALALVHARPGHPWKLRDLAREAASSRSNLTKRFTELVGQPPMQYVARLRMQVASTLLAETGAKVAAIGTEVGYDSEAAFSRAFKKATTLAPGAWRQ
ncbi:MAG: AraC family transcriptional regulator, partial [Gemmatimonadota bacterium]